MKHYRSSLGLIWVLTSLQFFGCADEGLPNKARLDRTRVLALIADTPEVDDTGATITITPVISDPGGTATFTYTVEACLDPGVTQGATPNCENGLGKTTISETSVSGLSGAMRTSAVGSFSVTLPSGILSLITRSAKDQYNGISYLVIYQLKASDGRVIRAFRKILVSTRGSSERNTNPAFSTAAVLNDGATFSSKPSETVTLTPELSTGAGTYYEMDASGVLHPKTEKVSVLWFSTDGSFLPAVSNEGESVRYSPPTQSSVAFVALALDGRGGAAVKILNF